LLRKHDGAPRPHTLVGLDRLNVAESLGAAILGRTHSEQKIGEVLKRQPSSSEANVGGFQMLCQHKDARANRMLAVNPRKSIRPRIRFAAVQPVAKHISRLKTS